MSLLDQIRKIDKWAARNLEEAGFRTDAEIKSLDRTDICELFDGRKNLKLRKNIMGIIHPKRPVDDLVRELKDSIPRGSVRAQSSILADYLGILKDMKTQMDSVQNFLNAHISLLEDLSSDRPPREADRPPGAKTQDPSGPETPDRGTVCTPPGTQGDSHPKTSVYSHTLGNQETHPSQDLQDLGASERRKGEAEDAGNSSVLLPEIREVKYNMIVSGQTFNTHHQLIEDVKKADQTRGYRFSESSEGHQVTLLFRSITSRMESDAEAAMTEITDGKPVILVLMHHCLEPTYQRSLKENPKVVLHVHVFFHETKSGLLTCNENSVAISAIRNKLLEYSTQTIPEGNLEFKSERREEAESGAKGQDPFGYRQDSKQSSNKKSKGGTMSLLQEEKFDFQDLKRLNSSKDTCDKTSVYSHTLGNQETHPSQDLQGLGASERRKGEADKGGNSSVLLPEIREVKYNMIVSGQTFNTHHQLIEEVKKAGQTRGYRFSESSEDHQVTLLFRSVTSRMESDAEAAIRKITDGKPVILVLMHHCLEPTFQRSLKENPKVVLHVHVFFHELKSRLLTCNENSVAIAVIRNKLLEYSTQTIPEGNLEFKSERREEAESGAKGQDPFGYRQDSKQSSNKRFTGKKNSLWFW